MGLGWPLIVDAGRLVREFLRNSKWTAPIFSLGRSEKLLAISVGERVLWVAEMTWDADAAPHSRVAEFVYSPDSTLDDAERLGGELANFLSAQNLSTRRVVFGVPAKWLIVEPYEMPPADAETASNVLWLHATERVMPALGPMVFDFMGDSCPTEPRTLLLVGLQRRWRERLMALAAGAGLKVVGITPIGTAVGAATSRHVRTSLIALFGPGGLELIDQKGQYTRSIHYIRSNGSPQPVIAELRRAAAARSLDSDSQEHGRRDLVLWDDIGMEPEFLNAVRQSASLPITEARGQWVGVSESGASDGVKGLSAVALTLNRRTAACPSIDFLRPRLGPSKRERWRRPGVWLPWAVAAVVLIALAGLMDMLSIQKQISGLDNQLQAMQPALDVARPYVATMQFAESFGATRPRYLACIGDLTQALPPDGQTYLISFNLRTDMKGEVFGNSTNEQNVLNFRDKLNASGRFADLMCKLDARETRGNANNVSFSITFVYLPQK
jgi:hypothetical protein